MAEANRRIKRQQTKALKTMATIELAMTAGMSKIVKLFLERVSQNMTGVQYPVSATDIVTLGELAGWWEDTLNADLALLVLDVWTDIKAQLKITETAAEAAFDYTMAVRNRLVEGLTPSLPEDAFNKIRLGLAEGALRGYSTDQMAERIAADLNWDSDSAYWRGVKEGIDAQIDAILDPYGSPGDAVREAARLYDTRVQALREMRNLAIGHIDRDKSYWQVRAERIARTESTGIYNAVAYQSFVNARAVAKMWVATEDHRTRPSHAEADGQVVKIFDNFIVGGAAMLMPGAPNAPASEVINCRCTMIGLTAEELAELQGGTLYGFDMNDVEIPAELLLASANEFYSPGQPRDGHGRWTKGLGGYNKAPEITARGAAQAKLDSMAGTDLQGLPSNAIKVGKKLLEFHSNAELQSIADKYMAEHGLGVHPSDYVKVRPEISSRIAGAFEAMKHDPGNPEVQRAYTALKSETLAQYEALTAAGYEFEFYPRGRDPYPISPREAIMDLTINKHMHVYPTLGDDGGFGDGQIADNPLLEEVPNLRWNGKPVTYNDVFRGVHDAFGHGKEGVGFRADGEDNAYRQHHAMFSPQARRALATETRGQNSWLNFGPYGEKNRTASAADTVFADQKTGLLPDWAVDPDIHKEAS